jgi:hypothetical protein
VTRWLAGAVCAVLALLALALACGRYGPPERAKGPARTQPAAPVTDPAVPR